MSRIPCTVITSWLPTQENDNMRFNVGLKLKLHFFQSGVDYDQMGPSWVQNIFTLESPKILKSSAQFTFLLICHCLNFI